MTGNDVVLDTSAVIKLLNDIQFATQFLAGSGNVHISAIAAGELLYGTLNSARHASNVPRFQAFIDGCQLLPVPRAIAERYARIRIRLKQRGLPIPEADIWIAATAIEHDLPLATADRHFSVVEDLVVVTL